MLQSRIPPEILFEIVEKLSPQGDTETLRNCALVSSSFLRPARRQLFSEIYIQRNRSNVRNQLLYLFLSANPEVFSYIKKLEVSGVVIGMANEDESLSQLLDAIADKCQLEILVSQIYCGVSEGSHFLPPLLRKSLLRLVRIPHLHTIHFLSWWNSDIPLPDVVSSPKLKRLSLTSHFPRQGEDSGIHYDGILSSPPSSLEYLGIGGPSSRMVVNYLTGAGSPLDISSIRSLTLTRSNHYSMLAAATVMQLAGAKIEHFRWEFPDPSQEDLVGSPEWFLPVELRLLPRLRSLTIVTDSQIVQAFSVRDLLSARSLPENSPIDRITIILICANLDLIVSQIYETRMDESLSVVGLGRSPPRPVQITIWILCDPKIAKSLGTDVASSWTVWGEQLRQWFPLTSSREPPVKGGIDGFSRFFQLLEDDVVAV